MFCKMCVTVALCLTFLLALSEGFFMPLSLRKQAPQTTHNSQQWIPSPGIGNSNGANTIQAGYLNPKDYNNYPGQQPQSITQQQQPQQQQQQQQPQQQQQQQPLQLQGAYSSQLYSVQATAPKYEPIPFQSVNQPQYAYEGVYSAPYSSYPQQSVQLVPCLCPVNKEVLEQQSQQIQQQTSVPVTPPSSSFPADNNVAPASAPQTNPKKAS